jgi:hypothetical protein
VPLLVLACHRQTTAPELIATDDDLELTGPKRIVTPGEQRSGFYAQPVATAVGRDKDGIRSVIRGHLAEIRACYERGLARKPDLAGTLKLTFAIAEDGSVASATTEIGFPDERVADCVAGIAKTLVFPPADGHGVVVVTYPFTLRPDASGGAR